MAHGSFLVASLLLGYTLAFMDPCTFYPRGFLPENETEIIIPTPSCQNGVIDWNYPKGTITIKFNQKDVFQLCVKNSLGGAALTLFDNSFGKEVPLKTLSEEDQCIRSHGHTAILDVKAPPPMTYMTAFSFAIKIGL